MCPSWFTLPVPLKMCSSWFILPVSHNSLCCNMEWMSTHINIFVPMNPLTLKSFDQNIFTYSVENYMFLVTRQGHPEHPSNYLKTFGYSNTHLGWFRMS